MMKSFLYAVMIMTVSKFFFAIQDVIIKEMSSAFPIHEIVTIRGLVAVPILLVLMAFMGQLGKLRRHRPGLHFLRGTLMFLAFMCFYLALSEISLTTTTALFFTAPFFITLLAIPMLGERVGIRRIGGIVAGFIGVIIVLRPSTDAFNAISLLPILAAFFYALAQLMIRYRNMVAPASIMSLYAAISFILFGSLSGLLLSSINPGDYKSASHLALLLPWSMPESVDLYLIMFTGVTSAFGFMASSYAYQIAEASRLASFEYVMIIWVTLFSYLVWSEVPDTLDLLGISIIIASGIYVLRREHKPIAYSGLTRR
jgi:S-adenosylmethionine uptake transporter